MNKTPHSCSFPSIKYTFDFIKKKIVYGIIKMTFLVLFFLLIPLGNYKFYIYAYKISFLHPNYVIL